MNLIKDCIETTPIFSGKKTPKDNSLLCQVEKVFQTKVPLLIGCIEPPIHVRKAMDWPVCLEREPREYYPAPLKLRLYPFIFV